MPCLFDVHVQRLPDAQGHVGRTDVPPLQLHDRGQLPVQGGYPELCSDVRRESNCRCGFGLARGLISCPVHSGVGAADIWPRLESLRRHRDNLVMYLFFISVQDIP